MHLNSNLIAAAPPSVPASPSAGAPIVEKELGERLLNFGSNSNILDATNSAIAFFWNIAIVVVITFIVVSGVKFITSSGDKTKTEDAKNSLKYSIIALILLVTLQYVIFTFFVEFFGGGQDAVGEKPILQRTNTSN